MRLVNKTGAPFPLNLFSIVSSAPYHAPSHQNLVRSSTANICPVVQWGRRLFSPASWLYSSGLAEAEIMVCVDLLPYRLFHFSSLSNLPAQKMVGDCF